MGVTAASIQNARQDGNQGKLVFKHYPAFAEFILAHHLEDYVKEQIRLSRELQLPMLQLFDELTDQQLFELGLPAHREFLQSASKNTLQSLLNHSMKMWEKDELTGIGREDIVTEDLTLGSHVRKAALLKLLPLYTTDLNLMIAIINEIGIYETEAATQSIQTYINILKERIHEHSLFIESIANTSPSSIYVFDRIKKQDVYTNKKMSDVLGYTAEEIRAFGSKLVHMLVHPEDIDKVRQNEEDFDTIQPGEVRELEYRVRDKYGKYRWIRAYESIFKKDKTGAITEKIGVAIDIQQEKETQQKLAEREQQLIEAQELADMGSYELDFETGELHVTSTFLKITGLTEGCNREDYMRGIYVADREKVTNCMKAAIEGSASYDCEYRFTNTNQEERIIWARGKAFKRNGRVMLKGTLMDVTGRHLMIQKLQRSEELYKQAQAMSHIGNWTRDLINNSFTWSDEMYRIYGLELGTDISYDLIYSFNHPDDRDYVANIIENVIKTKEPYDYTYRIVLRDGREKIVEAKGDVVVDNVGNPYKLVGTVQDVTQQKFIERELMENQAFIRKIADTTPSLIVSYNINSGKFTYVNSAFEKILGYSADKALNEGFHFFAEIVHPDDVAPLLEKYSKAIEDANINPPADGNEMVVEFKYRMRHRDGGYRWFRTYGTIFDRNELGKVDDVLNVSVDITEQEEAEIALYQKNLQLQQSNASLEEYAYVASHDLKEPLRKISTFGDRLLTTQKENLSEDGKLYLDKIISSSHRMQNMISDLLAVSMITGNKEFENYSLQAILNEVVQALEHKIEEKKATVFSDGLPVVKIIPSQFRQLIQNLISNSLKFTKEGRSPELRVTHRYLTPANVEQHDLTLAKKYLEIEFADNGIGFDNQYAVKIFTIFQRLHGKGEYEGTGIGLSVCKKIAENHGGTMLAHGEPDVGATFTVIIPI